MDSVKVYAFADEAGNSLNEQIDAMKGNSLDGLEIRTVDGENVSDISLSKAREIRKRLDDEGLTVWSIGSPIGKTDIEKDSFPEHIEKFKHTLDIADILDAKCFRLFSFYVDKDKAAIQYKNEVIDRLGQLAEIATSHSVTLCHENEKGIFGDSAANCVEIHRALPQIKGIFDPANFIQCGQNTLAAWKLLKPYIKYIHIKDALADGSVVPAGKGIGNVKFITNDFIANGGFAFTIEPHLTVFTGLDRLERKGAKSTVGKYVYESNRVAFDTACNEFKKLLNA